MNDIFDGHGYIAGDVALAVLITFSAVLTYARIAFETGSLRLPFARGVIALGFTILSLRFWYTLLTGGDVLVAPISMVSMALVTSGYSAVQIFALKRALMLSKVPIFCFRDPEWPCQREDRIQEEVLKELKK